VAVHELVHVLGAVENGAPNLCKDGHVCDAPEDLLAAFLSGNELDAHVLDAGRNDYYGHDGSWLDVQDSFFLEPLDSPDRTPPTVPGGLRAGDDPSGAVRFSWRPSTDDVGPVAYRLYQDDRFVREVTSTSALLATAGDIARFGVRAVDAAGRLSSVASARFRDGVGMIDGNGRLIRDTVRPGAIARVTVRLDGKTARISWPAVKDAGGLKGYRIQIGARSLLVRKPAARLAISRLKGRVSVAAIDRAGNVGPALTIPRSRFR
jgi:hypothetical protein